MYYGKIQPSARFCELAFVYWLYYLYLRRHSPGVGWAGVTSWTEALQTRARDGCRRSHEKRSIARLNGQVVVRIEQN